MSDTAYLHYHYYHNVTAVPRDLHSFPTRRSSDLGEVKPRHLRSTRPASGDERDKRAGPSRCSSGSSRRSTAWPSAACSFCCRRDRKSTRLNSSHRCISYAVFFLKKKNMIIQL